MLSAIILTKNNETTLATCLKSLAFTDEQLVIDSGSTDKTIALAHEHKAKVIPHAWEGYGAQKNFAAAEARGDWLLFIDADEEVTIELREAIQAATNTGEPDFFWLRIVTVFLGKALRHLYGHNPRLFRKSAGHWTADYVHEQVQLTNGTRLKLGDKYSKLLPGVLLHYSHDTIRSYLNKMRHYTTLEAKEMRRTGTHRSGKPVTRSLLLPWHLSSRQFIKLFFYRHGWKDGWAGCIWCVMSAYYEFELGRKFL
jgi:glycosyltransferase involved in cell wall biosynthesis